MIRTLTGIAAVAALMTLAACGGGDDEGIADTSWVVETLADDSGSATMPLPGTTLSADFDADQVVGLAGCNSYFGPYTTDSRTRSPAGPLGATRRFCDPAAIMEQEANFLELLATADRWERNEDQLKLFQGDAPLVQFALARADRAGRNELVAAVQQQPARRVGVGDHRLGDHHDLRSGHGIRVRRLNAYSANYTAGADTLEYGPAPVRRRTICDQPAGIMEQETTFLSNLAMVATYGVTADGVLEMFDTRGCGSFSSVCILTDTASSFTECSGTSARCKSSCLSIGIKEQQCGTGPGSTEGWPWARAGGRGARRVRHGLVRAPEVVHR